MDTYRVVRYFEDDDTEPEVISTGLTLEQARTHCRREDTKGHNWFDGYEKESRWTPTPA